jgi:hypothetical protein
MFGTVFAQYAVLHAIEHAELVTLNLASLGKKLGR